MPVADSSNSSRNRLLKLATCGALLLLAVPLAGQTDPSPAPPEAPVPDRPTVEIAVIGQGISTAALASTLGSTLETGFSVDFTAAERFGPQDLFRARIAATADIHVWVDTTTPGVVRLYFANRDGSRYLVRTMELSPAMDEMDREALAQAIEWSLSALTEGRAGMSREEAETLLRPAAEPAPALPPPPAVIRAPPAPRHPTWRRRAAGWLPEVASFYRVTANSNELGLNHGPGLRGGVDRVTPRRQLGLAGSAQYQFPQRFADEQVSLELHALAIRGELRLIETNTVARVGILAAVGAGFDATWISTDVQRPAEFTATPLHTSLTPVMTGVVGGQYEVDPAVRIELGVGAELDLVRVHYDVASHEAQERVVTRWPVRPAATLAVEFW